MTLAFYTGGIPLADGYISFSHSPCTEGKRSEPPTVNLEYIVVFRPGSQLPLSWNPLLYTSGRKIEVFYSSFCGGGPQGCNMRFTQMVSALESLAVEIECLECSPHTSQT